MHVHMILPNFQTIQVQDITNEIPYHVCSYHQDTCVARFNCGSLATVESALGWSVIFAVRTMPHVSACLCLQTLNLLTVARSFASTATPLLCSSSSCPSAPDSSEPRPSRSTLGAWSTHSSRHRMQVQGNTNLCIMIDAVQEFLGHMTRELWRRQT